MEGAIEEVKASKGELTAVLIRHFLELTIRPLFAKTQKRSNVTAQGRAVTSKQPLPRRHDGVEDETTTRPWKSSKDGLALDLLAWSIKSLDYKLTEAYWPLLIPPLLTLLDDVDVTYKAQGCTLLSALLRATPHALLSRTGLANVFHEAIIPSLSYLPSLTPEADSHTLLNAAYPCLLSLARIRFPTAAASPPQTHHQRTTYLTSLLHTHLLPSINHISDSHPLLVATLLTHLRAIISALAIDTIPQLMHILPILTSIFTAPFAASCPGLMAEAARTMQVVLANAWPRAAFWRGEVLAGLCGGWVCVMEELDRKEGGTDAGSTRVRIVEVHDGPGRDKEGDELAGVRKELRVAAGMLVAAVDATTGRTLEGGEHEVVHLRAELARLLEADSRLEGLLGGL